VLPVAPSAPALSFESRSSGAVNLTWAAAAGATSYRLSRDDSLLGTPVTGRRFSDAGLSPDTEYRYSLQACNDAGCSSASAPIVIRTAKLANDTGITDLQCYRTGSDALVSCSSAAAIALSPAQDGMVGRDAETPSANTDGKLGFSYVKIGNAGEALDASASSWRCVKDDLNGLVWEIKTSDGGLRDKGLKYTNYDDPTKAQVQVSDGTTRSPTQAEIDAGTNSIGFRDAVNTAGLCGAHDWRLPTIDELHSLIDYGALKLTEANWFPDSVDGAFYRASDRYVAYFGPDLSDWVVGFGSRVIGQSSRGLPSSLRLVRTTVPSSSQGRFSYNADGSELTDARTGLVWRRCSEGQTWSGSECVGEAQRFSHEAALARAASQSGWRLPNIKELSGLVDTNVYEPAMDRAAFPNVPGVWASIRSFYRPFWSSTPMVSSPERAWTVDFSAGYVESSSRNPTQENPTAPGNFVRLVR
jgi:hypothetical protein